MNRLVVTLAGAALGALLAAGSPAFAQDAANQPAPPAVDLYTPDDARAVLDARLAALKTVIGLTPEQQKLWEPLEAAIRKAAQSAGERRSQRAGMAPPDTFLEVLDRIADAEAARAADLKSVVAAAKPLVASLSEEQRRRIPAFLGMKDSPAGPQPTAELWIFEEEQD